VDLFDEAGIGGGASGVSGGLLHPYSPKGKLLWKGREGWQAALSLLAAAEAAAARRSRHSKSIAWRRGILRPLVAEKHIKDARKLGGGDGLLEREFAGIRCLERPLAQAMVPGLELPENGLGLYIPGGINLHPRSYLDALWLACEDFAFSAGGGTRAALMNQRVSSLAELSREGYEAVVVCTGSKAVLLPELAGKLPLSMCRGVVAHLELPLEYEEYDSQAPNLLTHTWLAVQGAREMVLGATKDWSSGPECADVSAEEGMLVQDELLQRAAQFYPLIKQWKVKSFRAGVRAMPPRTPLGALPLAGVLIYVFLDYWYCVFVEFRLSQFPVSTSG
jgi:glycine/D-amino acid oxidase-like deaminating enzyme